MCPLPIWPLPLPLPRFATTNQAGPGSAGTWFRRDRRFAERAEVARRDVSAHRPADAGGAAGRDPDLRGLGSKSDPPRELPVTGAGNRTGIVRLAAQYHRPGRQVQGQAVVDICRRCEPAAQGRNMPSKMLRAGSRRGRCGTSGWSRLRKGTGREIDLEQSRSEARTAKTPEKTSGPAAAKCERMSKWPCRVARTGSLLLARLVAGLALEGVFLLVDHRT